MFKAIFLFELKHWLRQPAIYLYAALFAGMGFLIFIGSAGMFDAHSQGKPLLRLLNSPFELNYIFNYFNKFFLFLLPAIVGASIYRDYKHQVHQLLYSFPIPKSHYLWAKYLSATLIVFTITAFSDDELCLRVNSNSFCSDEKRWKREEGKQSSYFAFFN